MNTTPLYPQEVLKAVKAAMEAADVTPAELAVATGYMSYTTLWRRLQGKGRPFDLGELAAIADALGVSVTELTTPKERAS